MSQATETAFAKVITSLSTKSKGHAFIRLFTLKPLLTLLSLSAPWPPCRFLLHQCCKEHSLGLCPAFLHFLPFSPSWVNMSTPRDHLRAEHTQTSRSLNSVTYWTPPLVRQTATHQPVQRRGKTVFSSSPQPHGAPSPPAAKVRPLGITEPLLPHLPSPGPVDHRFRTALESPPPPHPRPPCQRDA